MHSFVRHRPFAATRRSSDLSKHSAEVFREVEVHPVFFERRDGSHVVLMTAKEDHERTELTKFAGMIVAAVLDHASLEEGLTREFPWMFALSEKDRKVCAREIVEAFRAAFSTGEAHQVLGVVTAWQESAAAIAAGLVDREVEWLDEPITVGRP